MGVHSGSFTQNGYAHSVRRSHRTVVYPAGRSHRTGMCKVGRSHRTGVCTTGRSHRTGMHTARGVHTEQWCTQGIAFTKNRRSATRCLHTSLSPESRRMHFGGPTGSTPCGRGQASSSTLALPGNPLLNKENRNPMYKTYKDFVGYV